MFLTNNFKAVQLRTMNTRYLETFVAIAEAGNFQRAAERVNLTESAVSMQMKALENDLQIDLFDRSTRPFSLSSEGQTLLNPAREILRSVDAFHEVASNRDGLSGTLRLGAILAAAHSLLPQALASFCSEHPRMQVRVERGLSEALEERVAMGSLDAAVITEQSSLSQDLAVRTLLSDRLLIAVRSDAPDLSGLELLQTYPFIRFSRGTGVGRIIDSGLLSQGIVVSEKIELDSMAVIIEMVSHGLGVSIVPEHSISKELSVNLRTVPFGEPAMVRKIGLITRRRRSESPLVRALFSALQMSTEMHTQKKHQQGRNQSRQKTSKTRRES